MEGWNQCKRSHSCMVKLKNQMRVKEQSSWSWRCDTCMASNPLKEACSQKFTCSSAGALITGPPGSVEGKSGVVQSNDPHDEPSTSLLESLDLTTGDEGEEMIFKARGKLFRYNSNIKAWQEGCVGEVKILKNLEIGRARLLMKTEKVHQSSLAGSAFEIPTEKPSSHVIKSPTPASQSSASHLASTKPRVTQPSVMGNQPGSNLLTVPRPIVTSVSTAKPSSHLIKSPTPASQSLASHLASTKPTVTTQSLSASQSLASHLASTKPTATTQSPFAGFSLNKVPGTSSSFASSQILQIPKSTAPVTTISASSPFAGFSSQTTPSKKDTPALFGSNTSSQSSKDSSAAQQYPVQLTALLVGGPNEEEEGTAESPRPGFCAPSQSSETSQRKLGQSPMAVKSSLSQKKEDKPNTTTLKGKNDNYDDDVIFMGEVKATPEQVAKAEKLMLPANFYLYEQRPPCPVSEAASQPPSFFGNAAISSLSFASLSADGDASFAKKDTSTKPFQFAGAGAPVFGSTQQDDDNVAEDQEYDPHYDPIISLPENIDLATADEGQEVVFKERAKLYRYDSDTQAWKERGVGDMKILVNPETGKARILMRREQVLKVCASHWLKPDMQLLPMSSSDRAFVWNAIDFAEGEECHRQFALKFKTPKLAAEFKKTFDEMKEGVKPSLTKPVEPLKEKPTEPVEEMKPAALMGEGDSGHRSHQADPVVTHPEEEEAEDDYDKYDGEYEGEEDGYEEDYYEDEDEDDDDEYEDYDDEEEDEECVEEGYPEESSLAGSAFEIPTEKPSSHVIKSPTPASQSSASHVASTKPRVTQPSVMDTSTKPFQFAGAGVPVFGSTQQDNVNVAEDQEYDPHYDPIISLPENIDLTTGDEGQEVVFKERAKLYRYDSDTQAWKERGVGDMKILVNPETGKARILMRREQVLKVCASHWLKPDMQLLPMSSSDHAFVWNAIDFAEGEECHQQFALRFKAPELAAEFKKTFDEMKEGIKPSLTKPVEPVKEKPAEPVEEVKPAASKGEDGSGHRFHQADPVVSHPEEEEAEDDYDKYDGEYEGEEDGYEEDYYEDDDDEYEDYPEEPCLADQFKPTPGSWDCDTCMVNNPADKNQCLACSTTKPGAASQPSKGSSETQPSLSEMFKPASAFWDCNSCMINNPADKVQCMACSTPKPGSSQPSQGTSRDSRGTPGGMGMPSLADQFKPAPGSWNCDTCMVNNPPNKNQCLGCSTAKPGATAQSKKGSSETRPSLSEMFKPASGSWVCDSCMISNPADKVQCMACSTPNPGSSQPSQGTSCDSQGTPGRMGMSGGAFSLGNFKFSGFSSNPSAFSAGSGFGSSGFNKATLGTFLFGQTLSQSSNTTPSSSAGFSFPPRGFSFTQPKPETSKPSDSGGSKMPTTSSFPFTAPTPPNSESTKSAADSPTKEQPLSKQTEAASGQQTITPKCSFGSGVPQFTIGGTNQQKPSSGILFVSNSKRSSPIELTLDQPVKAVDKEKGTKKSGGAFLGNFKFSGFSSNPSAFSAGSGSGSSGFNKSTPGTFLFGKTLPQSSNTTHSSSAGFSLPPAGFSFTQPKPETSQPSDSGGFKVPVASSFSFTAPTPHDPEYTKSASPSTTREQPLSKPTEGVPGQQMITAPKFNFGSLMPQFTFGVINQEEPSSRILFVSTSGSSAPTSQVAGTPSYSTTNQPGCVFGETQTTPVFGAASEKGSTSAFKGFEFGTKQSEPKTEQKEAILFSDFVKNQGEFSFSVNVDNATSSPLKSGAKSLVKSLRLNKTGEYDQEEQRDDIYFEPVVTLPENYKLETGEENEEVKFSQRAKLYRFDVEGSQWKERGVGDIKVLYNPETKKYRIVMRREQVCTVFPLVAIRKELCLEDYDANRRTHDTTGTGIHGMEVSQSNYQTTGLFGQTLTTATQQSKPLFCGARADEETAEEKKEENSSLEVKFSAPADLSYADENKDWHLRGKGQFQILFDKENKIT
ncbi:E3 SUMO-protein ligase RanBP2 [Holothuria leucospilota]|uniref:Nuclear pore complex protein Nup153 n=1 Tax=Holothuria leucospilota TaxID=206669 RepID=A0A9Q1H2Q8_HOLLE|nr:E3 SUMO-protein ligase RanBP2 [Holothuria leucospilota]